MPDYITRESALDSICTACELVPIDEKELCPYKFTGCEYGSVFALPSADVVKVKHSRWDEDGLSLVCADCGWRQYHDMPYRYCPNCGARMDDKA